MPADAFGNAIGNSIVRGAQNADRNREIEAGKQGLSPAQLQKLEDRAQLTGIPLEDMLAARGAESLYSATDTRFHRDGFDTSGALLSAARQLALGERGDGVPSFEDLVPDDNFDVERLIRVRNSINQLHNEDNAAFNTRINRYINTYDGLDIALEQFSQENLGQSLNSILSLSEYSDTGGRLIGYVAEGEEFRFYEDLHRIDTVANNPEDARIFGETFLAFSSVASGAAQLYVGANPASLLTPAPIRGALLSHGAANVIDGIGQLEEIFLGTNNINFKLANSNDGNNSTNNPIKSIYSGLLSPLGVDEHGVNLLYNVAELGLSASVPISSSPSRLKGLDSVFARPPRTPTTVDNFASGAGQLSHAINLNQALNNPLVTPDVPAPAVKSKAQLLIEKLIREGRY